MNKIIGVNKPKGWTSFDVVAYARGVFKVKKIGHAGTLDPLAEGVLVLAVGSEATKKIAEEVNKEKEYLAKVKLGETSTTDDEEGEKTVRENYKQPKDKEVEAAVKKFIGEIEQLPPKFSAIKVGGKRAYKLAREGKEPDLKPRPALIPEIEIIAYDWPFLTLRVVTGPGVYIRSLARDLGEELKTGGYLADLKRTRVGDWKLEDCYEVKELGKLMKE